MHNRRQSARFRLRDGTADCHERVDALFSAAELGSRRGYEQFLLAQAAAFLPAERALYGAGIATLLPDWPNRRRSHLLVADLAQLGFPVPDGEILPVVSEVPALLGWVYVLEGSRLGGNILRRAVAPGLPVAFLSDSYPKAWPTLVAMLDEKLTEHSEIDQAIAAAQALFAVFERSGQRLGVTRITDVA